MNKNLKEFFEEMNKPKNKIRMLRKLLREQQCEEKENECKSKEQELGR